MSMPAHLISTHLPSVKQLQCFLAVAHELNFRRAAERLRMTQPPLTRQIQCLEAVLEQQLFHRTTHDVSLTDAGRDLMLKAEAILRQLSELKTDATMTPGRLRIGLTRTLNFDFIEPVSARLRQLKGEDEIETPDLSSAQLLQCLAKNSLDLIITGEQGPDSDQTASYAWICREPLRVALPTLHPASRQSQVALADIADLPLLWFPRSANPLFYDKCERYFSQLPVTLKRIKEPDDSLVMLSHIARGKGFALLPQSKCTFNQQGLCYRELTDTAAQQLNIDLYAVIRADEKRQAVRDAQALLCHPLPPQ